MGTSIRIGSLAVMLAALTTISPAAHSTENKTVHAATKQYNSFPLAQQAERLEKELNRFYDIQRNGGWQRITGTRKYYQKGISDPAVIQIKQRLRASGDFRSDDNSPQFTDELATAVRRIQRRYGFKENGVVDAELVRQLNVPVSKRIDQLLVNIERARTMPPVAEGTRLIANIPEFKLHVYEGDRQVFDMAIVVGSESNRTVIFNDQMTQIVFSPYWNVPPSIVENEILPAMRRNRGYLRNNGYEQTGYEDGLPVIRQKPGARNSLGKVKFVFPNDHAIYFHDTPAKSLFEMRKRAFSHGCIRLAEPAKLAQYLLRNAPGWTPDKIQQAMDSGREQTVKLPSPVAVSLTYFTAWVDDTGFLHFREDIYGQDKDMAKRIAKN